MKTFKLNDVVNHVAEVANLSKYEASMASEAIFDYIRERIIDGDRVLIDGFGGFRTTRRVESSVRNNLTGQPCVIPECRLMRFKTARSFRNSMKIRDKQ